MSAKDKLLSRSLDGELSPAEQARLERLLAEDAGLRQREQDWRALGDRLRAEPVPPPPTPEAAWMDVQRAIRLSKDDAVESTSPVFGWRLRGLAVMLLLVMAGLGWWAYQSGRPLPAVAPVTARADGKSVEVEFVETDIPGASPMVYEDSETGWTVVWVAGGEEMAGARGT